MQRLIFEAEHDAFRESARRFYQREVGPHGERWREQGCVDREVFRKAGEQGYLLMWADEQYGGAGVEDFRYEQILIEENARHGDPGFSARCTRGWWRRISAASAMRNNASACCRRPRAASRSLPLP